MKLFKKILALCIFCAVVVQAQNNDKITYTTYFFNDSGDNEVITTSFSLAKKIISGTALLLDIELDKVSLPPVDGATGATRPSRKKNETFEKNRGQVILGIEQALGGSTSFAVNAYRSQELDYISNAAVVTLSKGVFQNNTTLTIRGQYNDDKVGELLENGRITNRKKTVVTGALSIDQVLSKTTVLNMAYDFMKMDGFLSDPYRKVKVFDASSVFKIEPERHPDNRLRQALSMRLSQYLNILKGSLIGSYRYYFDDWEMASHTGEIRFNAYVQDYLISGFNYRYYIQNSAEFYAERYQAAPTDRQVFHTADYKLQAFQSNTFGINMRLLLKGVAGNKPDLEFLQKSSLEVMYLRYTNDLDFSANIIQASLNFAI